MFGSAGSELEFHYMSVIYNAPTTVSKEHDFMITWS